MRSRPLRPPGRAFFLYRGSGTRLAELSGAMPRSCLQFGCTVALAILFGVAPSAQIQPLRLVPHASGFALPIAFIQDPLDPAVQYVVQQGGRIRTVVNRQV